MFKLLGNKKLLVLLAALIFFIAIMGLTLGQRDRIVGNTTWPEKFVKDTVSWVQGLMYKPAAAVAGLFEDIRNMRVVYEENRVLRGMLAEYARDRARLNALDHENKRLMQALSFTEAQRQRNDYVYHIAHVVAENPDPFNRTLRINLGETDGIALNWAVVTPDGLIGRIVAVEPFFSTVQLITSTDDDVYGSKAIAATALGKESAYGIIESYDFTEQVLLMTKISQDDPLTVGDIVVSSGKGQVFPKGVVIGEVISREVGESGITETAKIRPGADFTNLWEVFVIEVPGM